MYIKSGTWKVEKKNNIFLQLRTLPILYVQNCHNSSLQLGAKFSQFWDSVLHCLN